MAFKDLRGFLEALEKGNDLKRITAEVDWHEEIGAISQEAIAKDAPALLFENIKDHQDTHGKKLVLNTHWHWRRLCVVLGLPGDTHPREMVNMWRERTKHPIKPTLINTGPCKDVIHKDSDVNLLEFPIPRLHAKDGGRYLTWHVVITKDPDIGWVNVGMYRGMVADKNSIAMLLQPTQHWGIHSRKYHKMGKSMPVAIAIGLEPITPMASAAPFPVGVNEYDMIGAIRQEPLELVKCETLNLEVPAMAEIVLEGEISLDPATFKPEGPFGEYPGHYTTLWAQPRPAFRVNCITHRRDPIWDCQQGEVVSVLPSGMPKGFGQMVGIGVSAYLWDQLELLGIQGITGVWNDSIIPYPTMIFVSIDKLYYGHAKQVAAALWGTSLIHSGKFVVVVDSDVDIFDPLQVLGAIAKRTQGSKDIVIYPGTCGGPLDPGNSPEIKEKTGGVGNWDRVLIDATWPFEWEAREEWGGLKHPPTCLAEEKMMEKVRKRWREYGLD